MYQLQRRATIQHVIAIGDPRQLRPNVNCYGALPVLDIAECCGAIQG